MRYIAAQPQIAGLLAARPPWSVKELDACFVVKDNSRQKLAYVYFEDQLQYEVSKAVRRIKTGG